MSDPSPTIPPFIPTGPTDDGLPGQIVWDRECIYTFDGAHWGRTPRAVSSGAWDDLYTPEGGPSARFLLVSKPQSLTDLEKEQAQLNIGLLPATTESFGIVRYTDSWMDNGSGDPGDYPVTLTRHAIMELIGNKLVAGTSNVTIAYDVTTGNTSISVSGGGGGGGEPFDGHLNADLVIGHGIVGTKAEWSVPLGDIYHQGLLKETTTGYSVFEQVDIMRERTVDVIVDDINLRSPLKFIVEAAKVSDSEIKLVALEPGTAPNAYTFVASGGDTEYEVDDPCFGTGVLVRTVNGSISVPASAYSATLNGSRMLSWPTDVDDRPRMYTKKVISSEAVYKALRNLPAVAPESVLPTDNVLINNHRYLLPVASSGTLNLASITVEPFGTVELWVDAAAGSSTVWPDWSWLDGYAPPNIPEVDTRYAIEATNDGRTVVAKLKYSYNYA